MNKKKKKRAKKLRKKLGLVKGEAALIVCVGKHCAPREESRAVYEAACARSGDRVRVERVGCLKVCKKGPIVATLPELHVHKRVDRERVEALADELIVST